MSANNSTFLKRNGLSIVLLFLFLLFWSAQAWTGWQEHNDDLREAAQPMIGFASYLQSAHFRSATFENWESEFLQMGMYVLLTVKLFQKGSSESKDPEGKEEAVDRVPRATPTAPWPVRRGGFALVLYRNSLSIAFFLLFVLSFLLHLNGSYDAAMQEHLAKGEPLEPIMRFATGHHFWFESFQNWQSEFLAVLSIVLLSIWLRQHGSPESKPVDAPHSSTGD